MNWNNAPEIDSVVLSSTGQTTTGTWVTVDITPLVTGNGTVTVALTSGGNSSSSYGSRESGGTAPRLLLDASSRAEETPAHEWQDGQNMGPVEVALPGLVLGLVLGGGTAAWIVRGWPTAPSRVAPVSALATARLRLTATAEVKVAAVGDMACDQPRSLADPRSSVCRQDAVSDAVLADNPSLLMALGDLQYEAGAQGQWGPYTTSYGRLRAITRPVPGNHEYNTLGANGYFAYFPEWCWPQRAWLLQLRCR